MVSVAGWSQALLKDCFKTGSRILCRTTSCTWSRVVVVVYSQQFRIALTPSIPDPEHQLPQNHTTASQRMLKNERTRWKHTGTPSSTHSSRTQALRQESTDSLLFWAGKCETSAWRLDLGNSIHSPIVKSPFVPTEVEEVIRGYWTVWYEPGP
jgi:hypothetical protein